MQYIPKRLYIGFRAQGENKPLSYIGYYGLDQKEIHKKQSIDSWRNNNIPIQELENTPVEGFILGKKVGDGGYGWDKRKAWIRVLDPRGFEVEISTDNLLSILESTSCIPVKQLQGKFVYFFDDGNLILLSCESSDYAKLIKHSEKLETKKITAKDLVVNKVYLTKSGDQLLYLGRLKSYAYGFIYQGKFYKSLNQIEEVSTLRRVDIYGSHSWHNSEEINPKEYNKIQRLVPKEEKAFWFVRKIEDRMEFRHSKAFPNNIIEQLPDEASSQFDIEKIKMSMLHHPLLHKIVKTEWRFLTLEEFEKSFEACNSVRFFSDSFSSRTDKNSEFIVNDPEYFNLVTVKKNPEKNSIEVYRPGIFNTIVNIFDTVEEAYNFVKPMYYEQTLENGNISYRDYCNRNYECNYSL